MIDPRTAARVAAVRAELEAGYTTEEWAVGRVLCPAGAKCTAQTAMPSLFKPLKNGRVPMHRGFLGKACDGAHQKPTAPPLRLRPTLCGTPSLHGGHTCVLDQGHTGFHANKTLAEVTPNGERIVWKLPEDIGDSICGDEYDGEECELEPRHGGSHVAGNLAWSYGRSTTSYRTA
ncbi:hypothetical protein [Streptomyces sp. NPDC055055]